MSSYRFVHTVPATPAQAWEVVADHVGMARWTPVRRVELERPGDPAPNGVGAIRVLHLAGPPIRERVTGFEPAQQLRYEMLSGAPVQNYTGRVDLEPAAEGTRITWAIQFDPKLPGVALILRAAIGTAAWLLARECTKRVQSQRR